MDAKSLEIRYDLFMNQMMAAKYLILHPNPIKKLDHEIKIAHEALSDDPDDYKDLFIDDLYRPLSNFIGLSNTFSINQTQKEKGKEKFDGHGVMNDILTCMTSLLEKKMAFSQDMLVLCVIYCNEFEITNGDYKKQADQFIETLEFVTHECLHTKTEKSGDKDNNSIDYKERNYQWFKMFLLHSNVWLAKKHNTNNTENKDEDANENKGNDSDNDNADDDFKNSILYVNALKVVNQKLLKQKQYVWDNIKREEKENDKLSNQLITYGNGFDSSGAILRQDEIEKGVVPKENELELILQAVSLEDEREQMRGDRNASGHQSNLNILFESNTKTYLTQCLSYAHVNNHIFQNEMAQIFGDNKKYPNCNYQATPVKVYDRCVIKATSDYGQNSFPSAAHALEF